MTRTTMNCSALCALQELPGMVVCVERVSACSELRAALVTDWPPPNSHASREALHDWRPQEPRCRQSASQPSNKPVHVCATHSQCW